MPDAPPILLVCAGEKRQRRHANDAEWSLGFESVRTHVVTSLLVDPRQRAMEEGPVQTVGQNRIRTAAHLAKFPERIELFGDVLLLLL